MEDSTNNRERFFALYWGKNVGCKKHLGETYKEGDVVGREDGFFIDYLELKSLKYILDEDCIFLSSLLRWNIIETRPKSTAIAKAKYFCSWIIDYGQVGGNYELIDVQKSIDYLRSKGYLVPWMDLSCEEIIERGWARYENS